MIPYRRLFRIVLSAALIGLVWMRIGRQWRLMSATWLIGASVVSLILLLVVVFEFSGMRQKWSRPRENVPKRPLGLSDD